MEFAEIDGSQGEGGGQILRTSISLSCVVGKPLRITQIRAGRKEPGLKPQHLQSILSAAEVSGGILKGAEIGSTQVEFIPGTPKSTEGTVDTHTAGSVVLIAQTLIPIAILCSIDLEFSISGGTEVENSPTVDYLSNVALPAYQMLGAEIHLELRRRGYYPKGGGKVVLRIDGSKSKLRTLEFKSQSGGESEARGFNILSTSRLLPDHVSQRQLKATLSALENAGLKALKIETDSKGDSTSPGSSILVYRAAQNTFLGASALGERGKRAETVGEEAADEFVREERNHPNLDSHLADMIVPIVACLPGKSSFSTSRISSHLLTNLDVARKLTACSFELNEIKDKNLWSVSVLGGAEKSI